MMSHDSKTPVLTYQPHVDAPRLALPPGACDSHVHVFLSEVYIRTMESMPLTLMKLTMSVSVMVRRKVWKRWPTSSSCQ